MKNALARGCVAEFLGTFALVFFGAGSILLAAPELGGAGGLATIALAHGLVLAVFVTGSLYISGGQFNPAVSVALVVAGKQNITTAGAYIASQLVAAASGAGMLVALLGPGVANSAAGGAGDGGTNVGATIGSLTLAGDWVAVFGFEVILTFALMWAILRCLADPRAHALGGIMVGVVVAACILAAGPLTGASMNPARTFGPALYGHWRMHWVYWLAPMTGAVLAALVDRFMFARSAAGGADGGAE